jgi:hypothetical protein
MNLKKQLTTATWRTRREAEAKTGFWFFAGIKVAPWLKIVLSLIPLGRSIYGGMAIAAIGKEVNRVKLGDRITVEPCIVCGKCNACLHGNYGYCEHISFTYRNGDGAVQTEWRGKHRGLRLFRLTPADGERIRREPHDQPQGRRRS